MGRILFFLLLALAVYVGWRYWRLQRSIARRPTEREPADAPEPMVRCDVCGLNLPLSEAIPAPDAQPTRWYCCETHRRHGAGQ